MKIAIMLALHNNPEQANIFIRQCLEYQGCEVFIHIDRKGTDIQDKLIHDARVHILKKHYSVSWGDFTQIAYVLELMRAIRKQGHFDYYSIHSGNDLVVRPFEELETYLLETDGYAYLDCYKLPWEQWQYGGGLGRLALYWPAFFRKRLERFSVLHILRALYGRMYGAHLIPGKKLPKNIQFWGKSAWYTLREDCIIDCLDYIDNHPEFIKLFKNALCGDEIFFDTLINVVAQGKTVFENNNLRFIDMDVVDKKSVGQPRIMTMDDKDKIIDSGMFFTRKVDQSADSELINYFVERTRKAND